MSSSSTSGITDNPKVCRSSRPSPAKRVSRMIESPANSRRSVRRRDDDSNTDTSIYQAPTKRKRQDPTSDDHDISSDQSKTSRPCHKVKNRRKSSSKRQSKSSQKVICSQQDTQGSEIDGSTNGSQAVTLNINLVQDSDEENEKVVKKPKKEHQYDNIRDYFNEMEMHINSKGKPVTAFPCKFCGFKVSSAPSSATNLLAH